MSASVVVNDDGLCTITAGVNDLPAVISIRSPKIGLGWTEVGTLAPGSPLVLQLVPGSTEVQIGTDTSVTVGYLGLYRSLHWQCLVAVQAAIVRAGLPELDGRVYLQKHANDKAVNYPCVMLSPASADTWARASSSSCTNKAVVPVVVTLCQRSDIADTGPLPLLLWWREEVMRLGLDMATWRAVPIPGLVQTSVQSAPVIRYDDPKYEFCVSELSIVFECQVAKGA